MALDRKNPFGDDEDAAAAAAPPDVARRLSAAHQEALRVGDSPIYADRLANKLPELARAVSESGMGDEARDRIVAALQHAERVLRRDDDGKEAARHLALAVRLTDPRPRGGSPFLDD
jgi:hypothetical protein